MIALMYIFVIVVSLLLDGVIFITWYEAHNYALSLSLSLCVRVCVYACVCMRVCVGGGPCVRVKRLW